MRQQGGWQGLGVALVAMATLFSGSGCLSFLHPIQQPELALRESCRQLPGSFRRHVHVFMIHGLDPLDYANLSGVRDYLHALGFNQTYYGQLYHTGQFKREIHRILQEDANARFVLVGFSLGANMVRDLALDAKSEGVPIDLLVYLGGNTLENIPEDRPDNALRIVNILASGCVWNGAWLDGAENIHETDVWHFGSPTHPRTLEVLTREITEVAASVRITDPAESETMPTTEEEPTPRSVSHSLPASESDWSFLRPVSHLLPREFEKESLPAGAQVDQNRTGKGIAAADRRSVSSRIGDK